MTEQQDQQYQSETTAQLMDQRQQQLLSPVEQAPQTITLDTDLCVNYQNEGRAVRRYSIDSQSSIASNEINQIPNQSSASKVKKSQKMVIKKKLLPTNFATSSGQKNDYQATPPFMVLGATNQGGAEFERTYSNTGIPNGSLNLINQDFARYMSGTNTDHSDSDISAFETQSILESLNVVIPPQSAQGNQLLNTRNTPAIQQPPSSTRNINAKTFNIGNSSLNSSILSGKASVGTGHQQQLQRGRGLGIIDQDDSMYLNQSVRKPLQNPQGSHYQISHLQNEIPINIGGPPSTRLPPHPFAEKQSPFEETKQVILLALETILQFVMLDIFGNMLYYSWKCIEGVLVPIVASIGLLGHCL